MDKTSNKQKHQGIHPVTAAVTGVVVGAGLTTAGVIALKDEKNRKKLKKAFSTAKDTAIEYIQTVAQKQQTKLEEKALDGKKHIEKSLGLNRKAKRK